MPNPALPQTDFADWLSPMLVKELRQGVRTRLFVSIFILSQFLLLLDVSLTLLVASGGEDATTGTVFFWLLVAVPIVVALPLNALNAVNSETRANTLELLFLTRLTAFRIVAGKWFAVFVQSALLVCAVLPYLVLRYFIGGVNIASELILLGLVLAASALLSAAATGLSAYRLRAARGAIAAGIAFFLFFGINLGGLFFGRGMSTPGPAGADPGALVIVGLGLCGVIFLFLMLQVGANQIAPPAENHSAVMRLLALAGLAVAVAVGFLVPGSIAVTLTAALVTATICLGSLCEEPRWLPSLFRPYAARGWPGCLAGRLLYPGWVTGFLFTLVSLAGFGALMLHQGLLQKNKAILLFASAVGTLLLPAALVRLCFPKTKRAFALYLVVQLLCGMTLVVCLICDSALKTSLHALCAAAPLCSLLLTIGGSADTSLKIVLPATLASVAVLCAVIVRPLRRIRLLEKESLQLPSPSASVPAPAAHGSLA